MKNKLLEETIYEVLERIDPWDEGKVRKEIKSMVSKYIYMAIANWTQGRTKDYLPAVEAMVILGKKETLRRLREGIKNSL